MFKKVALISLSILALIVVSASIGAATYAFWTRTVTVNDNKISTATLNIEVNGVTDENPIGETLIIDNLYPSNEHSVGLPVTVKNTGSINLQYQLKFVNTDLENELIYQNLLVSTDDKATWVSIEDFVLTHSQLEVDASETTLVYFRLDPTLEDLSTMSQTLEFDIEVTAKQLEDTF